MRILTNMRFWQSRAWTAATTSIYPGHRLPLGRKPLSPLREALALYRATPGYDVVVTMGARESLFYGLFCLLTGRRSMQVMTELFIDDTAGADPLHRVKTGVYRAVARRSFGILTNSSAEVDAIAERFRMSRSKLAYVPMHTNILEPRMCESREDFILSAGFTHRDYDCLIRAAKDIPTNILIVCGEEELLPSPLPGNVEARRNCAREEYLDLLRRCAFVALPLKPISRATGQVVLLEAMAFGKAVVASRVAGVTDHIRDGKTGLLCEPGNAPELAVRCRELLSEPERALALGREALADILRLNTVEIHAKNKLQAIAALMAHPHQGAG